MLHRYKENLSESVRKMCDLTENDLGQGIFSQILAGKEAERVNVQEVLSLTFDTVESALWKNQDDPISRILFRIRCVARVIATAPAPFVYWEPSVFTVGGGKRSQIGATISEGRMEKDLPVVLYGEAQFEKTDGDWRLVNLKVDKSLPSAEWGELARFTARIGE